MNNTFLNPFDNSLEKEKLNNLVSGSPVNKSITECLLSVSKSASQLMQSFKARLTSSIALCAHTFFNPIKKNMFHTFNNSAVKGKVQVGGKSQEVLLHRDILGTIAELPSKNKTAIDIVMCYPLAPVSMPLCCPDGKRRKSTKSKLFEVHYLIGEFYISIL